jgi:hypothetical protein
MKISWGTHQLGKKKKAKTGKVRFHQQQWINIWINLSEE